MDILYKLAIDNTDDVISDVVRNQIKDKNSPYYGAKLNEPLGSLFCTHYCGTLIWLVSGYYNKDSKYYQSEELYECMDLCLYFIKKLQRPDGTFDLPDCNWYSAPDTGFAVHRLFDSYNFLKIYGSDEKGQYLKDKIKELIIEGSDGIVAGGFHTPNHRWVISSAIAQTYKLTGDQKYLDIINNYIKEGIDCNKDGEYAERSTGVYNLINNEALVTLAQNLDMPELYEPVARNLTMMLDYFEGNHTIFTANSTRQDKGAAPMRDIYFFQYRQMAKITGNKLFYTVSEDIKRDMLERGKGVYNLNTYMMHKDLVDLEMECVQLPAKSEKHYKDSGIVRIKNENFSISLLENNPNFMFVRNGDIECFATIGFGWFDERHFIAKTIKKTDKGYVLKYDSPSHYYLPFEEKQDTTDWWKMDHSKRKIYSPVHLYMNVTVDVLDNGVKLSVKSSGCDRIPVKFEFGLTPHGYFEADGVMFKPKAGESIILKSGYATIDNKKESLIIGPAVGKHRIMTGRKGTLPQSDQHFTVYFTDYTDLDYEFSIMLGA